MAFSSIKSLFQLLFVIAVVVIYVQYQYTSEYRDENIGNLWKRNVTEITKTLRELKIGRFPGFSFLRPRPMSYARFNAMKLAFKYYDRSELPKYQTNTPICFFSKSKLGPIPVNRSYISPLELESMDFGVRLGGFYAPPHCRPRHKVAILVPFRNRSTNLARFLRHIHPFLQKQLLQYRIFVIEQYDSYKFNKGALYNIAYLETQKFGQWDCLVFHDVDLLPMDERILYTCPRKPTHMCPALECWGFQYPYKKCFGGVTSMPTEIYAKVNGYSNEYWNWGAEDDDMFIRIHASKLSVWRYNMSIARFACLPHPKAIFNPNRFQLLVSAKKRYKTEGLRSLEYRLIAIVKRKLFTHILVNVNPFNYTV